MEIDYNSTDKDQFATKWTITTSKVGNGSYGEVFEVTKNHSDEMFVVKKFKSKDIYNREMTLEYFLGMMELIRKNPNPYIVKIVDRLY